MSHSLGGRSSGETGNVARVIPGFPPGLTPARAAWARTAIGPNRAQDLRDGSALPGPSPHLSKQAWHSAWFNRPWLYREDLQQPALTVASVPKCNLDDAVRNRLHLAVKWLTVYVGCSPKTPAASASALILTLKKTINGKMWRVCLDGLLNKSYFTILFGLVCGLVCRLASNH